MSGPRPYFVVLDESVYGSDAYRESSPRDRFILHLIAGEIERLSAKVCYPGSRLQNLSGASQSTFRRSLMALERCGLVEVTDRGGGHGKAKAVRLTRSDRPSRTRSEWTGKSNGQKPKPGQNDPTYPVNMTAEPGHIDLPIIITNTSNHKEKSTREDDDERSRVPDCASPELVKRSLIDVGVSDGRAEKLSRDPHCTPMLVRPLIAETRRTPRRNPGGYLATLVDEAIGQSRRDAAEQTVVAADARHDRVEAIDTELQDGRLETLKRYATQIEAVGSGLTPSAVVSDFALRREVASRAAVAESAGIEDRKQCGENPEELRDST